MTNVEEKLNASREFLNLADNQIKRLSDKLANLMLDALLTKKEEFEKIVKDCHDLDQMIADETRNYNQLRILNDIRRGKLLLVRADNGTLANVSFS